MDRIKVDYVHKEYEIEVNKRYCKMDQIPRDHRAHFETWMEDNDHPAYQFEGEDLIRYDSLHVIQYLEDVVGFSCVEILEDEDV